MPPIDRCPATFCGSTIGPAFKRTTNGAQFCLGQDAPHVQRTSVCVIAGGDAKGAMQIADTAAAADQSITEGTSACMIR
ncbi:hypothetical protein A0H81_03635 [Grifola frondosa]|uniref:Uncharacterized protein n=1 Tax=Grifola frondosa TaxID=5627 RepID=A0A1C7MIX5_GRIFR|nr:hypothetical protein A0H81_03635 [Grifola frondosa]